MSAIYPGRRTRNAKTEKFSSINHKLRRDIHRVIMRVICFKHESAPGLLMLMLVC